MFAKTRFSLAAALTVTAASLAVPSTQAQGWGMVSTKTTTITRLLPPTVNLKNKSVQIQASLGGTFPDSVGLDLQLKTRLQTLVQKDPRFIVADTNPQTVLRFTVTNFYTEKYTVAQSSLFGNSKETRTAYRGKIEVAYQAFSADSGSPLDSENLKDVTGYDIQTGSGTFTEAFHKSKRKEAAEDSPLECRDQMIEDIVQQMAMRISALGQPVQVRLPGGKLDPVSALAIAGRWGDVQEKAEAMEKFPKPQDDAYRLYLIALAKEAKAYGLAGDANDSEDGKRPDITADMAAKDNADAQRLLDEAGALYKEALLASPKDSAFLAGDTRTQQAISIFATIDRYKKENAKAEAARLAASTASVSSGGGKSVGVTGGVSTGVSSGKSPIDMVIDMCRHDMDPASVKEYIASDEFKDLLKDSNFKFVFSRDAVPLQEACKANAATYQHLIRARLAPTPGRAGH